MRFIFYEHSASGTDIAEIFDSHGLAISFSIE